ncbi:hypothetical protein ABZS66_36150 [Dactylosporangium sp. NPDC005572]|uniref:hypothetical protein n=1 Tax=Dactylosporangium sp. NPDC005572 TaxID=3156889 RepID=UPI00339DAEDE
MHATLIDAYLVLLALARPELMASVVQADTLTASVGISGAAFRHEVVQAVITLHDFPQARVGQL